PRKNEHGISLISYGEPVVVPTGKWFMSTAMRWRTWASGNQISYQLGGMIRGCDRRHDLGGSGLLAVSSASANRRSRCQCRRADQAHASSCVPGFAQKAEWWLHPLLASEYEVS